MATIQRDQITIGGLETSYLSAGDHSAQPVVLLHDGAWGGSAEASWREIIPILATRYRVIAPDLYGYGQSSKMVQLDVAPYEFRLRQVADLLDAVGLGATAAHFVGNSFGGAMALRASTLPWCAWRVRSAVSIAGTGGPYRTKESLVALSHFDGSRADMLRIVRMLTGDFDGIDSHVDMRMRDATSPGHYRAVAAAGLATPFNADAKPADEYPDNLRNVKARLALVSGVKDNLVERDWARKIAEHAPHCCVYDIEARHSPNISDPAATAALLLEILGTFDEPVLDPGHAGLEDSCVGGPR
ncbi:alpha/beta fold hydrolase [Mycolicibacterium helvum]|uniref:Alpha/beta hydrolase n=1 Tax=Mycolicibacterium helvum TaxID=1534349 RepID=A0A7I7TG47_9MYCO|nr:alpha/beta hydrolase [Mycolicibacterium helvum]BBY67673.1 alpha/beta hydrolase [Mycolicibacterium helvum]